MSQQSAFERTARTALPALISSVDLVHWLTGEFEKTDLFYGHGTDNAWDEALALVLSAVELPFDASQGQVEQAVGQAQKDKLLSMLLRRVVDRCPTPYITNEAWFAGLSFFVDERVLIPRSPLAEWIEQQFMPWVEPSNVKRILDVGTGSGCIGIALALAFPGAEVVATDVSTEALEVARVNVQRYQLEGRVTLLESDLFERVGGRFDLIVSNPPYVDAAAIAAMPPEFKHEPLGALEGGPDGLDLVRMLMAHSVDYLSRTGVLVVEVGASEETFERVYPRLPVVWLELSRGGEGVFLIDANELRDAIR